MRFARAMMRPHPINGFLEEIQATRAEDKRRDGTFFLDAAVHLPVSAEATLGLDIRNLLGRSLFPYGPNGTTPRFQRTTMLTLDWRH